MSKSGKRNAHGAGSIRKRTITKNGKEYTYWEGRVPLPSDPGTGKQRQRSVTAKTQAECLRKMQEVTAEINAGVYTEPSKLTCADWFHIWTDEYCGGVTPATVDRYRREIDKRIIPAFGAIKLDALTSPIIQKYYNGLPAEGLCPNSIKWDHAVIHGALDRAVRVGYLKSNPDDACTLPTVIKKDIRPFDDEDTAAFLQAISGHRFEDLYTFALFTGCRRGECLGLQWDDIDFTEGTVRIHQQLQRVAGQKSPQLVPTKNKRPRVIVVAPSVLSMLQAHRIKQLEARIAAGPLWEDNGLVFTNDRGGCLTEVTVGNDYKKIVASIGRPDARFHDLRHSYATAALRAGDDAKTVSATLGHVSTAFTLDTYAAVTAQMRAASAQRMEKYIQSVSNM